MVVEYDEKKIVASWRRAEGRELTLLLRSEQPLDDVLGWTSQVLETLMERYAPDFLAYEPVPHPSGVAVFFNEVQPQQVLVDALRDFVAELGAAGAVGTLGLMRNSHPPVEPFMTGMVAAVSLVGEPVHNTHEKHLGRRQWRMDEATEQRGIELCERWTAVPGGKRWYQSAAVSFRTDDPDLLRFCLSRSLEDYSGAVGQYGRQVTKTASIDANGHVFLGVGGESTTWRAGLDDLITALFSAAEIIDYAAIRREQVSQGLWSQFHTTMWGDPADRPPRQLVNRHVEDQKVFNAYGAQILHRHSLPTHERWTLTPLGAGRHLVVDREPERWFAEEPDRELLASARASFGPAVEDSWQPQVPTTNEEI